MQFLLYLIVVWSCIEFDFLVLLISFSCVSSCLSFPQVFHRPEKDKSINDWETPLKRLLWTCGSPVPCSPACRLQLRNIAGKGGTEGFFPQNLLFVLFFCHNDIWLIAPSLLRSSWEVCKILFFVPLLQVQVAGKFNTWPYHSQGDRPMWGKLKN